MVTNNSYHSDLAVPPGEFLEEVIADLGMTKVELAKRMNRPATKLSAIFKGEKTITPDTAIQLERVVGIPAHVWTGLESEYRLTLAKLQQSADEEKLKEEAPYVVKFCYKELVQLGYVDKFTKASDKVKELHKFFGVTSLSTVVKLKRYRPAFRIWEKMRNSKSWESTATWLRIGEIRAHQTNCAPFNKDKLIHSLESIRSMTMQAPETCQLQLTTLLANSGVALVILPHLPRTYAHGATFWQGLDKAVLLLTIRGSWADIFWFSLLHEIAHILLHGKQNTIIESDTITASERENEADLYASNLLIAESDYNEFKSKRSIYRSDIIDFANSVGVHPGIIVGRLQHDKLIKPYWHNNLRIRLVWDTK